MVCISTFQSARPVAVPVYARMRLRGIGLTPPIAGVAGGRRVPIPRGSYGHRRER
jgi:hypothetical protein